MGARSHPLSLGKKLALLALGLLGVALAAWMAFTPPQLRLRRIVEPPPEFRHDHAHIQGFSPDGSLLVIEHNRLGATDTLILRHVKSGRIEKTVRATEIAAGRMDNAGASATTPEFFHEFSHDGRLLAVGLQEGDVVKVYDTVTWRENATLRQGVAIACRFFPDDNTLLVNTTRGFTVWDTSKGRRLVSMENWCQAGNTRCFISPDGRVLTGVQLGA
jgi:hypothetical protein